MPCRSEDVTILQSVIVCIRVVLVGTFIESWKVAFVHSVVKSQDGCRMYKRVARPYGSCEKAIVSDSKVGTIKVSAVAI
jgi:hypothetical protein